MSQGVGQFLLSGEFAVPEHDGDETQVRLVFQGQPIEGFMPAENNAVAVPINEPQARVDEGAFVGGRIQGWKEQIRGRGVHTGLDAPEKKKFPEPLTIFVGL